MANFEDFSLIFCLTAEFLPEGGAHCCRIFTGASNISFQSKASVRLAYKFDILLLPSVIAYL